MTSPLLQVTGLTKRFGGFVALEDIELSVAEGERLGLIGPNGSGKTTLINCVSGILRADAGAISFDGRDMTRLSAHARAGLGVARSFQIPKPFAGMSVIENVRIPLEYAGEHREGRGAAAGDALALLKLVGLDGRAESGAASLNQIELRKLELARALGARPRLLISDEAMAGLSAAEVDEILVILRELNRHGITVIMIEHIMRAVMGYCERIVVLDAGHKIADGPPDEIMRNPDVERAYLGE